MMQCFVKAWLEDESSTEEKVENDVLYWDRQWYFPDLVLGTAVVVDGAAYVMVADDDNEDALRWEKEGDP